MCVCVSLCRCVVESLNIEKQKATLLYYLITLHLYIYIYIVIVITISLIIIYPFYYFSTIIIININIIIIIIIAFLSNSLHITSGYSTEFVQNTGDIVVGNLYHSSAHHCCVPISYITCSTNVYYCQWL